MVKETLVHSLAMMLIAASLWGCTASARDRAQLLDALAQREAAHARLAKAITAYCGARHDSLEARHHCAFEQYLEVQRLEQGNGDSDSIGATEGRLFVRNEGERASLSLVKCERARLQTTCRHMAPLLAER